MLELNAIEQIIAAWPLWTKLGPAVVAGVLLSWGIWSTKERVQ